jgi:hypothetical protein
MRILFVAGLACAACALVSCRSREYNQSQVKSSEGDASVTKQPPKGVTQVNPMAFNAFNIWRDGNGAEILDYPQGYDVEQGSTDPDGVFYVEEAEYWDRKWGSGVPTEKFIGVPTAGAKVVNDVLEYPVRNGKQLKLKFAEMSEKKMIQVSKDPDVLNAVTYCKNQGLRLPTVRELFDFCAAGVTEPNYGPKHKKDSYPPTERCREKRFLASASVDSAHRDAVWTFFGATGEFPGNNTYRSGPYGTSNVRCVGVE